MARSTILGFVLLATASYVSCSGFMEIRLQSKFRQSATVTITHMPSSETLLAIPIVLQSGKSRKLGSFPIGFDNTYSLSIVGGRVEDLGINQSRLSTDFDPIRGTLAPEHLHLPFNGLELIFECDENWGGPKCDKPCTWGCNKDRATQNMTLSTDYTVDMTKLPEIVKRLKETTKVENTMRIVEKKEEEDLKRRNKYGDVLGAKEPKKSPLSDLLKTIFALKDSLKEQITHAESIEDAPVSIEVEMDPLSSLPMMMGPMAMVQSMMSSVGKRGRGEDSSSFDPTEIMMGPMAMVRDMMSSKSREEKDRSREIEKHSSAQKSFGLRHKKPPASWEGPGEGMGGHPLFSLMSMVPRVARHTSSESKSIERKTEGSGEDFDFDQIIKTRKD